MRATQIKMFGNLKVSYMTVLTSMYIMPLYILCNQLIHVHGELLNNNVDNMNAISNLYDNLLQREYAGPNIFPSHQMERKAQRSPSLRLRFGRRSDPNSFDLQQKKLNDQHQQMAAMEKRWWGDVNQKPIRSPSLRLRFGKRQLNADTNGNEIGSSNARINLLSNLAVIEEALASDHNSDNGYEQDGDIIYDRVARKPQRLRWGRSILPASMADNSISNEQQQVDNDDKWRNLLMNLGTYEIAVAANNAIDTLSNDESEFEGFEREIRKSGGPLRLRWGRSTDIRTISNNRDSNNASNRASKIDGNLNGKSSAEKSLGSNLLPPLKPLIQLQQKNPSHLSNVN